MRASTVALLLGLAASTPAVGEVTASSDPGFVVEHSASVSADPATTWRELVRPAGWWQSAHTWSGIAANLTLDPRAGGCFCEALPQAKDMTGRGVAEHMRVIQLAPGRMLRMSGALGPMQAEAVQGTMTVTLTPLAEGTTIKLVYVVGGYMRMKAAQLAPAVDGVLRAQLASLVSRLGGNRAAREPATP
jgi:uncharacterized protein YndB with AHSA1/START domain